MKKGTLGTILKMNLFLFGLVATDYVSDNLSKNDQVKYEENKTIATKYDFPFGYTEIIMNDDTISIREFGNFKSYNSIVDYNNDALVDEFTYVNGYKRTYFRENDSLTNIVDFDWADSRLKKQNKRFQNLLLEDKLKE